MSLREKVQQHIQRVPYAHQLEAVDFFEHMPDACLLWDMGTGKTGGGLLLMRARFNQEKRFLKTLIVSPVVTLGNWENEIGLWTPIKKQNILNLIKGTGKKKAEQVAKLNPLEGNIVIVNYEALLSDELLLAIMEWGPEVVIGDEIHLCKAHNTKRSKAMAMICDRAKYRILMTGTPILNSVKDIFMPFRILDKGKTFGTNVYVFQERYMMDLNASWKSRPGYFPKYVANPKTYPELTEKIYTKAIRKLKSECLDLPPLIEKTVLLDMGKEQLKAYAEMKRDFLTYVDNQQKLGVPEAVVANLAMTKALRLMQIASGYVSTEEGSVIEFKENPKLEHTKELLEELTPNHKVIVWATFVANYRMLERICKEIGVEYVMLTGEQSTEEKNISMERFQNETSVRVIIANRGSGGIGVNLTSASYSIVYSRDFSLGKELQSAARNYRGGSQIHEQIVKIDLACKDTIDEVVLTALLNKQQISTDVIDIIKKS